MSPGYARSVKNAFARQGIDIAVLGCYINPVEPDSDKREAQIRRFEEHLRYVRDFGCSIVGTETSYPGYEKNMDLLYSFVERVLKVAEKTGAIVGIVPVAGHTLSSIEETAALIDTFKSPALGIIYDAVNLIPLGGIDDQKAYFKECLDAFGPKIVACHAKDFRMINGRKKGDFPALTGEMDYKLYLSLINEYKPGVDILLENSASETIGQIRNVRV
jgi:sugar phosphate isomerase/epimerase